MALSLSESQAVNEISRVLYDYLPGKAHPFANQGLSFEGVTHQLGLSQFWQGGSKLPVITLLLEKTLEARRSQFCPLILEIVRSGMVYRNNKRSPITRDEIRRLNELIAKVQFKIPELWDPKFLDSLPSGKAEEKPKEDTAVSQKALDGLKIELVKLDGLSHRPEASPLRSSCRSCLRSLVYPLAAHFVLSGSRLTAVFKLAQRFTWLKRNGMISKRA